MVIFLDMVKNASSYLRMISWYLEFLFYQHVTNVNEQGISLGWNVLPKHFEVKLFDGWGMNFMGPCHLHTTIRTFCYWSCVNMGEGNYYYNKRRKGSPKFSQNNIFTRFGMPWAIISGGLHSNKQQFAALLAKCRVRHRITLAYHLHTDEQMEFSDRVVKGILRRQCTIHSKIGQRN